jgi:hypothetical protein
MRLVPLDILRQHDLRTEWGLGRRFSAVLCLEVAEHLDSQFEHSLIRGLTNHSDLVVFSAACPGQPGQHHVNCQWPEHWQSIFNSFGFWCSDAIRWDLWMLEEIEPWYRQNMFIARYDPRRAGNEPRIRPVIHPAMAQELIDSSIATSLTRSLTRQVGEIEQGSMQTSWYFKVPLTGLLGKASRLLKSKRQAEP